MYRTVNKNKMMTRIDQLEYLKKYPKKKIDILNTLFEQMQN